MGQQSGVKSRIDAPEMHLISDIRSVRSVGQQNMFHPLSLRVKLMSCNGWVLDGFQSNYCAVDLLP